MCKGLLLGSGSSAVRYGLPISVIGVHVGHGYCYSYRVTKPLPSHVGHRSSLEVIELSRTAMTFMSCGLSKQADLETGEIGRFSGLEPGVRRPGIGSMP